MYHRDITENNMPKCIDFSLQFYGTWTFANHIPQLLLDCRIGLPGLSIFTLKAMSLCSFSLRGHYGVLLLFGKQGALFLFSPESNHQYQSCKKKCCYNIYYALISSWRKDDCNYSERNWPFKLHKDWVI